MPEQDKSGTTTGGSKAAGFWRVVQILSPILVVVFGFYFDSRLQDAQAELERSRQQLDRIEVAHEIIRNALSSDYEQCFITLRLVEVVLEPELAAQVVEGVTEYLGRKAGQELAEGRPEEAVAIVRAAQSSGGDAGKKVEEGILKATSVAAAPERLLKAKEAQDHISQGFRLLMSGRYQEAMDAFRKAEEAYPGYGSASEIVELLSESIHLMDDPAARKRVINQIMEQHSWKTQREFTQEMRQLPLR
jgi:tetratricopeptide (TPR) repeat protein